MAARMFTSARRDVNSMGISLSLLFGVCQIPQD
jgi:hypothetical protein